MKTSKLILLALLCLTASFPLSVVLHEGIHWVRAKLIFDTVTPEAICFDPYYLMNNPNNTLGGNIAYVELRYEDYVAMSDFEAHNVFKEEMLAYSFQFVFMFLFTMITFFQLVGDEL